MKKRIPIALICLAVFVILTKIAPHMIILNGIISLGLMFIMDDIFIQPNKPSDDGKGIDP